MNRPNRLTMMLALVSIALATGCAGPMQPGAAPALEGTWRGYFRQVGAGDTGYVHGDIDLQIAADGTYAGTWTTRQVAGSTRAGSTGDTLFGLTIDPGTGRTLSVQLDRVP
jgi:hypothetical protein